MKIKRKKRHYAIVLAVLMLSSPSWVQAQESETAHFSLTQAIDYALANHQNVKNAALEEEIAERKVGEILASGLPQISATATTNYNYKIQQSLVEANGTFPSPSVPKGQVVALSFGLPYTSRYDLSLSQMLFDGAFLMGLKAAKTFTQLSKKDHIKTKIDVVEAVSKAYFGVLVNKERYVVMERNYTRLDSLLRETQIMFDNGFSEKIDVSRVKIQYNSLEAEFENFKPIVALSESLLKFQMGLPLDKKVELSSRLESFDTFDFTPPQHFSYQNRVEFAQMKVQKALVGLDIRSTKIEYYPKLSLIANYGANTGSTSFSEALSNPWFGVGAIGLKLSWSIFDGLRKYRLIQQKQLQAQQVDYSLDLLKNSIDLQLEQSLSSYNSALDKMRAQRENMNLAQEVYYSVKTKYQEGVGTNQELIDADAAYKKAQVDYYNALYNALISKIDLQKAYGVLLPQEP